MRHWLDASSTPSNRKRPKPCRKRFGAARLNLRHLLAILFSTQSLRAAPTSEGLPAEQNLASAAPLRAELTESRSILLVRTPGDEGIIQRVRADLSGFGWSVIEVSAAFDEASRLPIEELARKYGVAAALRVRSALGQVELYMGEGWGRLYEVLRSESGPTDPQILALRTTEALRAHGLHLGPKAPAEAASAAASPPSRQAASSRTATKPATERRPVSPAQAKGAPRATVSPEDVAPRSARSLWVGLAPAVTWSPGGLGVGVSGAVSLSLELTETVAITAQGLVPVYARPVTLPEGRVDIETSLLVLGIEATWLRRGRLFSTAGVGIASLFTVAQGQDSSLGYRGTSESTRTFGTQVRTRFGLQATPSLRIFGALDGGVSFPEVKLEISSETSSQVVRSWGRPFGVASVGLELRSLSF